jgi:hypothetical protein
MITEAEAKERACCGPMPVAQAINFMVAVQHNQSAEVSYRCHASVCMAWRWHDTLSDDGTACHWKPTAVVKRHPDDTKDKPLDQRRGFCGLAGKP